MAQGTTKKQNVYTQAVGRRKTSAARVRLYEGAGDSMVNDKPAKEYFPGLMNEAFYMEPFKTTTTVSKFYFTAKVVGGGIYSQVAAVSHGLARALVKKNHDFKDALKKRGLLTRDPRMKERRKAGLAHAARARKSSPKR